MCVKSIYELIMKINEICTAMKMAVLLGEIVIIVRSGLLQALIEMILGASLLKIDALDCYFYLFIFLLMHSILCPTILVQGLQ